MIPDFFEIGCRKFNIEITGELSDGILGQCEWDRGVIKLSDKKEAEIPLNRIVDSLFHELLHAVDLIYCGEGLTEEQVAMLSVGWLSVLRTNDISFKLFEVPKRIFIIESSYVVEYPYETPDAGSTYSSDTYGVIKIVRHNSEYPIMHDFVRAVCGEIINKFDTDIIERPTMNSLSNGLLQLFRNSEIVELICNDNMG